VATDGDDREPVVSNRCRELVATAPAAPANAKADWRQPSQGFWASAAFRGIRGTRSQAGPEGLLSAYSQRTRAKRARRDEPAPGGRPWGLVAPS